MNYYKEKYLEDYKREYDLRKGWLLGQFMNEKNPDFRGTDKMAIKYWKFSKDEPTNHPKKYQRFATECTFILKGRIQAQIDNEPIELSAGDYVVIPPNVISNLVIKVLEDAEGLTIKAPSCIPDDTIKLP